MRTVLAFLLLASIASAQTATGLYMGVPVGRYTNSAITLVMDATGEDVAFANVTIPYTGTITKVGFRTGTVTAADELNVSIQTMGTDGLPSGSNYGSSVAGVLTTPTANTSHEITLATPATAVAGNQVAIVVSWDSFASGNLQIACAGSGSGNINGVPTVYHDAGAGFTRNSSAMPMVYLYYSDNGGEYRIPVGCFPPASITSVSIQSDTTPDEVAMKLTAPFACRANGVMWGSLGQSGTTAEITFDLFSNAATPLSLLTNKTVLVHDAIPAATALIGMEPESLSDAQVAYFSIFNGDATNNLTIAYMDVSSAAHWGDFMPQLGWASRTRTTDGSPDGGPGWTDLSTRKPIAGVFFDQVTAGGASNVIDPLTGTIPGL